jgi:arylsulfatase A-like enzyme
VRRKYLNLNEITMKNFSRSLLPVTLGAAAISGCTGSHKETPVKTPNIILIMSDDMGYSDIGCYGGEIRTPNLDSLAGKGLRFTQFYNTARSCPTRASLLTGLHPHQAGVGHMVENRGNAHYQGSLNKNCVTIAEVLKTAGYSTYMAGKWHVTSYVSGKKDNDQSNWPLQRGFDRYFGTLQGAGSFYDPYSLLSGNKLIPATENFYYTDAISDTVSRFIREHKEKNPYFIYVAYTAAHWPLHALKKDVDKYKGMYDKGWDAIRSERYKRMIEMGLIDPSWPLSPANPDIPWEKEKMKKWNAACMEVYAGMIDNMDQGIGRIITALKEKGEFDNTVILFLQDNGACAENYGLVRTGKDTIRVNPDTLKPMAPGQMQMLGEPVQTRDGRPVRVGRGIFPGGPDTFISYDKSWANTSNTPFRMYKHWTNEGGISTPLIISWPNGITSQGEYRHQPGQLVDIMATITDLAHATYPKEFKGNEIIPMEGASLFPAFKKDSVWDKTLYWEHEGNRAIRKGDWKLVSEAWPIPQTLDTLETLPLKLWELYDMKTDRSELKNLADKYPDRVKEMAAEWQNWAERIGAVPKPPKHLRVGEKVRKELSDKLKKFN